MAERRRKDEDDVPKPAKPPKPKEPEPEDEWQLRGLGVVLPRPVDFPPPPMPAAGGASELGVGGGELQRISPLRELYQPIPELNIDDFRWGIYTRPKRTRRPLGAMNDVTNFIPDKTFGALVMRTGYARATTSDSRNLVPNITDTGGNVITAFNWLFTSYTTILSNQEIFVVCSVTPLSIAQSHWIDPSTAGSSYQTSFLQWGERASTTISGTPTSNDFVLTAGSATTDYYKTWIVYNSTRAQYVYCTTYNGTTKDVTTLEKINQTGQVWAAGDSITLYRHFHDNPTFTPNFNAYSTTLETPPALINQGNYILFSGGQSSTVGNKLIWSGSLASGAVADKVFFTGAVTTLTYPARVTYISEAEIKSTVGFSIGNSSAYTSTGTGLDTTARWFIAFVLQTDDAQRSTILKAGTDYLDPAANQGIQAVLTCTSQINKRMRYVNVFLGRTTNTSVTTLTYNEYFYIKQIDLTASGWTYDGSSSWTQTIQLNITNWNARLESLTTHLGGMDSTVTTTVSCSKMIAINNRLIVARYYDYTTATNYNSHIRYGGFSGTGVTQFNVLPDISQKFVTPIDVGQGTNIFALEKLESKLLILKETSCYYINVNLDPSVWEIIILSRAKGCNAGFTAVQTPLGIMWLKEAENIYLWDGSDIRQIATYWLTDFQAITNLKYVANGWYDVTKNSYNFMLSTGAWYSVHLDVPVGDTFAAFRHTTTAFTLRNIVTNQAGTVYFTGSSTTGTYAFSSATTDAGTAITPTFDTGNYVISEKDLTFVNAWYLANEQTGTPAGTLDCQLSVDGTAIGNTPNANLTKTNTFHRKLTPLVGSVGRVLRFKFNTNAAPASWTTFTVDRFGLETEPRRLVGDKATT